MKVVMTPFEMGMAGYVGLSRRVSSLNRADHDPRAPNDWTADIQGAAGEMAFAKQFGFYWDGSVNTFNRADVGSLYQVKTAAQPEGQTLRHLWLQDTAKPQYIYILVLYRPTRLNVFQLRGWMPGTEAMTQKYWDDNRGSWLVPQGALYPMEDLP